MGTSTSPARLSAVLLAAGEGSRIRPISNAVPKAALPVGNRALILHHLDTLRAAGITDVIIVIGASGHFIRQIVDADPGTRTLSIQYVEQTVRRGIAHALACVEDRLENDFVLLLADVFIPNHRLQDAIDLFRTPPCTGVLGAKHENDLGVIRRNYSIDVQDGLVKRVIEKPPAPTPGLRGVGTYVFARTVFDSIRRTPPSALRGEQEITDAIQVFIDDGASVRAAVMTENDMNVNDARGLLLANLAQLDALGVPMLIADDADVHPSARLVRTVVGPRAIIGGGVELRECIVLEGVSIAEPGVHAHRIFAPGCSASAEAFAGGP